MIKNHKESFEIIDDLSVTSEQYITFIINKLTNYNWNSMLYTDVYSMPKIKLFEEKILKNSEVIYTNEDNEKEQQRLQILGISNIDNSKKV